MTRVLVTGANGQLGLALQDATKDSNLEIVLMDKSELDITSAEEVNKVFATQSFAFCINAAAYTDVDGAESNKKFAYAINATAVETLAKTSKQHGCWLIHISTDYVFDGTLDRPYTPSDTPNPLNVYGASKLAGEQAIEAVGGTYSIVRGLGCILNMGIIFTPNCKPNSMLEKHYKSQQTKRAVRHGLKIWLPIC